MKTCVQCGLELRRRDPSPFWCSHGCLAGWQSAAAGIDAHALEPTGLISYADGVAGAYGWLGFPAA